MPCRQVQPGSLSRWEAKQQARLRSYFLALLAPAFLVSCQPLRFLLRLRFFLAPLPLAGPLPHGAENQVQALPAQPSRSQSDAGQPGGPRKAAGKRTARSLGPS